jgi:hypothetical protein
VRAAHRNRPGSPDRDEDPLEARPAPPLSDLHGRQPVRLVTEDWELVAYGFGGQRIAIPAEEISEVVLNRGPALIVLDRDQHMLLKAAGDWDSEALGAVLASVGLHQPTRISRFGNSARTASRWRQNGRPPRWPRAGGYRRLRTRPRGFIPAMLATGLAGLALIILGAFAGAQPAVALPGSVGSVRDLLGIAGGLAGAWAAGWLFIVAVRSAIATVRWSAASRAMRSPAPWSRFYPHGTRRVSRPQLLTVAMLLAVPALVGWGPVVGGVTLVHGFSDQALVTHLRTVGRPALGVVTGVPQYTSGVGGNNTELTYRASLEFLAGAQQVLTPDPVIGGRVWPISGEFVTVIYDPAQPRTAAVAGQLQGLPWGGAPLGNLISGALLTLALPVLLWRLTRRLRATSRAARAKLLEGIGYEP